MPCWKRAEVIWFHVNVLSRFTYTQCIEVWYAMSSINSLHIHSGWSIGITLPITPAQCYQSRHALTSGAVRFSPGWGGATNQLKLHARQVWKSVRTFWLKNFEDIATNQFFGLFRGNILCDVFSLSEDEHGLIAQYCQSLSSSDAPLPVPRSPLQIMAAVDAEQKDELEQMIRFVLLGSTVLLISTYDHKVWPLREGGRSIISEFL